MPPSSSRNAAESRSLRPLRLLVPCGDDPWSPRTARLAPDESWSGTNTVPGRRRGVLTVGPVSTVRADPLGLFRHEKQVAEAIELIVHPRTVRLDPLGAGLLRDLEGQATRTIVSHDLEFHALRRQLDRLGEVGLEVVKVAALPSESVGERIAAAVDDRTAAAFVSAVFYRNAHVAGGLDRALAACDRVGARLVVDAYHALNVLPFDLAARGIEGATVTGGGYKYVQLGEGNAFLRFPADCALRPVVTGWFSEFALKEKMPEKGVVYGEGPARFAGATYDPTSHYRAAAVFDFFEKRGLTPALLREVSQHQVGLLIDRFDALDLDPTVLARDRSVAMSDIAGFLVLRSPRAGEICKALHARGVFTDYRADVLRMGPAPYLSDSQIEEALNRLGEVCRTSR